MNRTVTGIFADRAEADSIHHALLAAGFHPGQVKVLDFQHLGRRSWFERRIASTSRAVVLGAIFGVLGGALAGLQFGLFGSDPVTATLLGAGVIGVGGALLGTVIGRSTSSQIRAELVSAVAAGRVLVSVTTDQAHAPLLQSILAREGGSSIDSGMTHFSASILAGRLP